MDYKKKWEQMKQWLERAVEEGQECGYNEAEGTFVCGAFYAYRHTLEEMKRKEENQ